MAIKKNKVKTRMKLHYFFTAALLIIAPTVIWLLQPKDDIHQAYAQPSAVHTYAGPIDTKKVFNELMNIQLEEGMATYESPTFMKGVKSSEEYTERFNLEMANEEKRILEREAEVAAKYNLSREQVEAIIAEGAMKGWLKTDEAVVLDAK